MTERTNSDAAEELFGAWERWDLEAIEGLISDDAVDRRPQSGERFVGRANIMAQYREVPGPPVIRWERIRGGPEVWVAEGVVEYGEGPIRLIGIVVFSDGAAVTADYYFANPFAPPAGRERWAEPIAHDE